jgi:anhydro-N-acetylmuramic acid kinase
MPAYIGLMSGTSLDGVDGVLVDIAGNGAVKALAHAHRPFETAIRAELLALNSAGADELHRCALAANAVARTYAAVVADVLRVDGRSASDIVALGAHGQTVRHRPGEFDGAGYTVQLLNAALLAELSGIDVVADFRSRDVAARGQGAPLAPGFHAAVFAKAGEERGVLNLGGIANLTRLGADGSALGFDTGPANALLDGWCERHLGQTFDANGDWAAGGRVIEPLLAQCLAEPFFQRPPPKSTGRDLFNLAWLDAHLARQPAFSAVSPQDVQATLAALTVRSVAQAVQAYAGSTRSLFACGGGARNTHVLRGLAQSLPGVRVSTTGELGVPVDQVEAVAFAWLAQRMLARQAGNLPAVTGAAGSRVLGALYPK